MTIKCWDFADKKRIVFVYIFSIWYALCMQKESFKLYAKFTMTWPAWKVIVDVHNSFTITPWPHLFIIDFLEQLIRSAEQSIAFSENWAVTSIKLQFFQLVQASVTCYQRSIMHIIFEKSISVSLYGGGDKIIWGHLYLYGLSKKSWLLTQLIY